MAGSGVKTKPSLYLDGGACDAGSWVLCDGLSKVDLGDEPSGDAFIGCLARFLDTVGTLYYGFCFIWKCMVGKLLNSCIKALVRFGKLQLGCQALALLTVKTAA